MFFSTANDLVVFGMRADPKPGDAVLHVDAKGTIEAATCSYENFGISARSEACSKVIDTRIGEGNGSFNPFISNHRSIGRSWIAAKQAVPFAGAIQQRPAQRAASCKYRARRLLEQVATWRG